jgi:hypothetical protein
MWMGKKQKISAVKNKNLFFLKKTSLILILFHIRKYENFLKRQEKTRRKNRESLSCPPKLSRSKFN